MTTAGRFDLTRWDETPYAEVDGEKYARVSLTKAFEGGLEGSSEAELLQVFLPSGAAAYVGIERVTAALDGRKGSFVFQHAAAGTAEGGTATIDVVPGSGTGELAGLTGRIEITRAEDGEHTYTFAYEVSGS